MILILLQVTTSTRLQRCSERSGWRTSSSPSPCSSCSPRSTCSSQPSSCSAMCRTIAGSSSNYTCTSSAFLSLVEGESSRRGPPLDLDLIWKQFWFRLYTTLFFFLLVGKFFVTNTLYVAQRKVNALIY